KARLLCAAPAARERRTRHIGRSASFRQRRAARSVSFYDRSEDAQVLLRKQEVRNLCRYKPVAPDDSRRESGFSRRSFDDRAIAFRAPVSLFPQRALPALHFGISQEHPTISFPKM